MSESKLKNRDERVWSKAVYSPTPPVPRNMLIEVASICNHSCLFCAYKKSTRAKRVINIELFRDLTRQAFDMGTREIGLYSGAEPLMCPNLADHIAYVKQLGFEYIYITTNGSICDKQRLKRIIDAGIDSLKFSINGGDRDTYKKIHGKDHFDKVMENVKFAAEYRAESGKGYNLFVSFVECSENKASFPAFRRRMEVLVDEVYHVIASNQSGQVPELPAPDMPYKTCAYPFNQLHVSVEGYLRLCCNDYQNFLAFEDLNKISLAEAWNGHAAQEIRRRHLENDLKGTLCFNCLYGVHRKCSPLNKDLSEKVMI